MTTAISIEDVRREVKILKALSGHNNLVKFHDACEDALNVYVIMEYVDLILFFSLIFVYHSSLCYKNIVVPLCTCCIWHHMTLYDMLMSLLGHQHHEDLPSAYYLEGRD